MREEERSPRALHAQPCHTPEITSTSPGSSDAESKWNAGKNKDYTAPRMPNMDEEKKMQGPPSNGSASGQEEDAALIHKCQKSAVTVVVATVIATLIVVIISLAVYSTKPCSPCFSTVSAACPDSWIGYGGKCFYVSKEERNWSLSLKTCSSFNASLAVIDTQKELDFWVEIFHPLHYWFGLSREINQVWKWYNGTEFKNQFAVRGEGFCAYMDGKGASSTICSMEKRFLCSRPESCSIKRRELAA